MNVVLEILKRCWEILTAPVADPSMLWVALPLFLTMVLMEIYYARHKKEELGWNTAFANALVLIFVGFNLMRVLFEKGLLAFNLKLAVVILMMVFAVVLAFLDFYHLIPRFIAFEISSKLPLNYLAYVVSVYVYTDLAFDWISVVAALLLFVLLVVSIKIIKIKSFKK